MPAKHRATAFRAAGTRARQAVGRFLACTRAGATAIAAAAVTVMAVGATALITDHLWLIDQRDTLKSAANAAAVAATHEMTRQIIANPDISNDALITAITPVARRYVELNLTHLPAARLTRAKATLVLTVTPHRNPDTVDVTAAADLGGTLFSRHLPLLGNYTGPETIGSRAATKTWVTPVEVVLAIDVSHSMQADLEGGFIDEDDGDKDSRMDIVKSAAKTLVDIVGPDADNRVAIGVVPWHFNVRLADTTAATWSTNGWARYPTQRTYDVPYECDPTLATCKPEPPDPVDDQLPAVAPEDWKGCLDGHRMGSVGRHAENPESADLFTLPSVNAFSQGYFPALHGSAYRCWELSEMTPDFTGQRCYSLYDPALGQFQAFSNLPPQYGCGASDPTILPLSTDRATIIGAIDALSHVGAWTYSALGVLWAHRLLLSSWRSVWGGSVHPVDPTSETGMGIRKVIVLLTDGEDSFCGDGNVDCTDSPIGISRTDACDEAKDEGFEIFVVAAMHPDQVSSDLGESLTECSSQSDDSSATYAFLNNATPESLETAFASIADQLRRLRRTH